MPARSDLERDADPRRLPRTTIKMPRSLLMVFLGVGLAVAVVIGYRVCRVALTYRWEATECTIVSSGIHPQNSRTRPHRVEVRYAYKVDDVPYNGATYRLGYEGSSSLAEAQRLLRRYPRGSKDTCYVHPSDPERAFLKHEGLWFGLVLILPLILVALGAAGIRSGGSAGRRRPVGDEKAPVSISARADKGQVVRILIPFFAVFFLAGCAFFYGMFLRPALQVLATRSWVETPCTITSSRVGAEQGSDGTDYRADITYVYTVNGTRHKSSRYGFAGASLGGVRDAEEILGRYPLGGQAVCYVDPGDPEEAVLSREFALERWLGLFPLIFVLAGGLGLFFTIRYQVRKSAEPTWIRDPAAAERPAAGMPDVLPSDTPVTLQPRHSPLAKFIGVTLFAAFWNGIVLVFLLNLFTWFLLPFILVGVAAAGGTVYVFLSLFNPRPRLVVSSTAVPLGGAVEVQWRLTGRTLAVRALTVTLEGREEATYQRGTSTYTDRKVFAALPIAEVEDPRKVAAGRTVFRVPADTVHTFSADNNKIVWYLRVHGDIGFWPDVCEEFPFVVLPVADRGGGR